MKNKSLLFTLAACALAVTFTACDKKTPVEKATDSVSDAASKTADAAKDMAGKTADAAKDMAGKAADMAGKATETVKAAASTVVSNVMSEMSNPFNDGIAAAKKSIADKDYKGALAGLTKLSDMKLSDEQTKVVDNLKAEVQKLIAGGSASTVDAAKGLFGK